MKGFTSNTTAQGLTGTDAQKYAENPEPPKMQTLQKTSQNRFRSESCDCKTTKYNHPLLNAASRFYMNIFRCQSASNLLRCIEINTFKNSWI